MKKAIVTEFIGPHYRLGQCVKVTCGVDYTRYVLWDNTLSTEMNHRTAANNLFYEAGMDENGFFELVGGMLGHGAFVFCAGKK